jgi:hypothetical protein
MTFVLGNVAEGMEGFPFFSELISWSLQSVRRVLSFRTENFSFRKRVIFLDDKTLRNFINKRCNANFTGWGIFCAHIHDWISSVYVT